MGQKSQLAMARMRLYRADRTERRLGMDARKADTRNKIQLGGLIVKAGRIAGIDLAEEPAVLLGLLLETAKSLGGPRRCYLEALRDAGSSAFVSSKAE